MKITIYDLLGLVKDGKSPKEIKYKNFVYGWVQKYKTYTRYDITSKDLYITTNNLNDEVEIIEKSKKIEKIKSNGDEFYSDYIDTWISKNKTDAYCEFLMNKINELIDAVNELKRNK